MNKLQLSPGPNYDNFAALICSVVDLRVPLRRCLSKNLMLQTTRTRSGDDLPLFGRMDSDWTRLMLLSSVAAWKRHSSGVAELRGGRQGAPDG